MRALAAILLLAVVPTALASHPSQRIELQRNLDRDRALERIVGIESVTFDHSVWRANVHVVDRCRGRARVLYVVRGHQRLESVSPVQADGRGAVEVVGVLRGIRFDQGEARVSRLTSTSAGCPRLRTLFRYLAAESAPPAPAMQLTSFRVEMHELETAYPGRELVLTEQFQLQPMLSSVIRVTQYRYDRASDAYVVYATNMHRIP